MSSTWPPGAEGVGEVGSPIGEVVLDTWCQVLGTKCLGPSTWQICCLAFSCSLHVRGFDYITNCLYIYQPTSPSLTHSLTHPLTHPLTHSLTHSLNLSLARSPSHSLTIGGLVHWPVCTPTSHDYPYMSVPACRVLWNIALTCLSRHVRPHDTWHLHACPGVSLC